MDSPVGVATDKARAGAVTAAGTEPMPKFRRCPMAITAGSPRTSGTNFGLDVTPADAGSSWCQNRQECRNRQKETNMTAKLDPFAAAPDLIKAWLRASTAIAASLDPTLMHLVEIRASQINGCANCINMHTTYAREKGETEQRIYLLSAWREAPCYTDRERAALGWTEALTRLSEGHTHESAYEVLKAHFTEAERVKLTLMVNVINGWNRIAVGFGAFADPAAVKATTQAAVKAAAA
jgi:AhpD family alkylhydroperoxidase